MGPVVIIEDDQRIRELMARALESKGYDVHGSATALDGFQWIVGSSPDVVILDMGLPDLDGTELLKMIRAMTDVPIVVATARSEDRDIVRTLDAGADDYLVKPFSVEQLDARVRAVLRRASGTGFGAPIAIADLLVDPRAWVASVGGEALHLSPREIDLLVYLAERVGVVVSKRQLMSEVWMQPDGGSGKTVDVHISWLRRKLGETAADSKCLETVYRVRIELVDPS